MFRSSYVFADYDKDVDSKFVSESTENKTDPPTKRQNVISTITEDLKAMDADTKII